MEFGVKAWIVSTNSRRDLLLLTTEPNHRRTLFSIYLSFVLFYWWHAMEIKWEDSRRRDEENCNYCHEHWESTNYSWWLIGFMRKWLRTPKPNGAKIRITLGLIQVASECVCVCVCVYVCVCYIRIKLYFLFNSIWSEKLVGKSKTNVILFLCFAYESERNPH